MNCHPSSFQGLFVRKCLKASKRGVEEHKQEQRMRNTISNVGRKAQGTPDQLLRNTYKPLAWQFGLDVVWFIALAEIYFKVVVFGVENNSSET